MLSHNLLNYVVEHSHKLFNYDLQTRGSFGQLLRQHACEDDKKHRCDNQCDRRLSQDIDRTYERQVERYLYLGACYT